MIAGFVDTYLNLGPSEEVKFKKALETVDLVPEQKEEVVEIVTSWERKGIETGMQKGRLEELQTMLLDELVSRFGQPNQSMIEKVRSITSVSDLRQLTMRALRGGALPELGL